MMGQKMWEHRNGYLDSIDCAVLTPAPYVKPRLNFDAYEVQWWRQVWNGAELFSASF
jgi:hypothetical protein